MVSDGDTTGRDRERRSRLASVMSSVAASLAAAAKAACSDSGPGSHNAFDRLDCRKGRYDLGDMLSWRDRRLRGEARRGRTPADPGPASAAVLLGAAAAGRRRTPKRPKRRDSGHCGGLPIRGMRRRARKAGYALAMLLGAAMAIGQGVHLLVEDGFLVLDEACHPETLCGRLRVGVGRCDPRVGSVRHGSALFMGEPGRESSQSSTTRARQLRHKATSQSRLWTTESTSCGS